MIANSRYLVINPTISSTYLDDEAVLMNAAGDMYGLSQAGAEIWKMLDSKPRTIDELINKLQEKYSICHDALKEDVQQFIANLCKAPFIYEKEIWINNSERKKTRNTQDLSASTLKPYHKPTITKIDEQLINVQGGVSELSESNSGAIS